MHSFLDEALTVGAHVDEVGPIMWTLEEKRRAAVLAPTGGGMLRKDTHVIQRPGWYQLVTPSAPGTVLNEVVVSAVEPDQAERVIDEAIATYRAIDRPVKWCVGPWTRPDDFGERLEKRGFRGWHVRAMGCETTADLSPAGTARGVVVHEVTALNVAKYVALVHEGWDMLADDGGIDLELHAAAFTQSPRVAWFFAASLVDAPASPWVGTGGLLLRDGYGYVVGAQVLPSARGKGVYRALVAARLSFLRARGLPYAVTHAREATSAPMLAHLGWETLFPYRCYVLDPAS